MARSFNGSSEQISATGLDVSGFAGLSMGGWFNAGATLVSGTYYSVVTFGGSFGVWARGIVGNVGKVACYSGAGGGNVDPGSTTVSVGTWYHVLMVATAGGAAGSAVLYLNGASQGTFTPPATFAVTSTVTIGNDATSERFNGSLADIAIWNVQLTAAEVSALAAGARPINVRTASLKRWWPLDGIESTEPELSGNHDNGTLTGTALASGPPLAMFTPRWPVILTPSTFNAAWAQRTAVIGAGFV